MSLTYIKESQALWYQFGSCIAQYTLFFISNTFICNARLKLAENQTNAKQHAEAELLLFENYSHSSYTLSSKNNRTYSKKTSKRTSVSVFMRL